MSPINCPRLGGLNDTRTSATANTLADLDIIFIAVSCFSLVASLHWYYCLWHHYHSDTLYPI